MKLKPKRHQFDGDTLIYRQVSIEMEWMVGWLDDKKGDRDRLMQISSVSNISLTRCFPFTSLEISICRLEDRYCYSACSILNTIKFVTPAHMCRSLTATTTPFPKNVMFFPHSFGPGPSDMRPFEALAPDCSRNMGARASLPNSLRFRELQ